MPQSTVTPEASRQAFDARLAGATLREIADGLGFSVEGARKLLEREAQRQVSLLHDELVMAGTLELPIPSRDQLQAALAHVRWAVGELAERGVRVRPYVVSRGGVIAIGLEEHAPEEGKQMTKAHVDRLNGIRDRTRSARERVSHARQQRHAAMERAQAQPGGLPRPGSPEALRVLDLIPSQPMTGNSFTYSQEVAVDGASEVVEGRSSRPPRSTTPTRRPRRTRSRTG